MFGWGEGRVPTHFGWTGGYSCDWMVSDGDPGSWGQWCHIHIWGWRRWFRRNSSPALILQVHEPLPLWEWVYPSTAHFITEVRVAVLSCCTSHSWAIGRGTAVWIHGNLLPVLTHRFSSNSSLWVFRLLPGSSVAWGRIQVWLLVQRDTIAFSQLLAPLRLVTCNTFSFGLQFGHASGRSQTVDWLCAAGGMRLRSAPSFWLVILCHLLHFKAFGSIPAVSVDCNYEQQRRPELDFCIKPQKNWFWCYISQESEALVYLGVSSSRSLLATKLGIREGCTSPSMPSNRRAIRSFLHRTGMNKNSGRDILLSSKILNIKSAWGNLRHKSWPSHLFISQSLTLVVMPSNRFLSSETNRGIEKIIPLQITHRKLSGQCHKKRFIKFDPLELFHMLLCYQLELTQMVN